MLARREAGSLNSAHEQRKLPPIAEAAEDHHSHSSSEEAAAAATKKKTEKKNPCCSTKTMPVGRRGGGIGSCSGVDESIVRAFFVGGNEEDEDDDDGSDRTNNRSSSSSIHLKGCQGPLSMLANFITCWHPSNKPSSSASGGGGKAWEKRKAAALLELNKQQQAALADKQDTIDMLEWQLEQLQVATSALGAGNDEELVALDKCLLGGGHHPAAASAATADTNKENLIPNCPVAPSAATQQMQQMPMPSPPAAPLECSETSALVLLFEMAVVRARLSIRYFCSLFLKQMEASGYPVCRALAEMEPSTGFIRKEHTAYVLDARINKAFFGCFENESFDETGITAILDPTKRCAAKLHEYRRMKCVDIGDAVNSKSSWFEPEFLRFCQAKTRDMWAQFRFSVAFRSVEERDAFTAAFLDVAKGVWLLHRLAFAMNPAVSIIRVGKGMDLNPNYVEPVAVPEESCCCAKCGKSKLVEFMIMPGFRTQKKVIKCQVYQHVQCK